MTIRILNLLVLLALSCSLVQASVAINLELGRLSDSSGATLPDDTLWALVAEDSLGDLAGNLLADSSLFANNNIQQILDDFGGATIAPNQLVGDNRIIATGNLVSTLDSLLQSSFNITISNFSGLAEGDKLAVYWFPGQTLASNVLPANNFQIGGFHRTNSSAGSGGNGGMVVPNDGNTVNMFYFDDPLTSGSSGIPLSEFQAITAVPEPSTLLLLGSALIALILPRRRR